MNTPRPLSLADIEAQIAALAEQLKRNQTAVVNATEVLRDAERERDRTKRSLEGWQASLKALKDAGIS